MSCMHHRLVAQRQNAGGGEKRDAILQDEVESTGRGFQPFSFLLSIRAGETWSLDSMESICKAHHSFAYPSSLGGILS